MTRRQAEPGGRAHPGRPLTARPVLATLAALLFTVLTAAGCVSMPSGGPVQSYPMTQGTSAQNQPYVQLQPQSPGPGWNPQQIVEGFLAASASFGNYPQVVQEYLTPQERKSWSNSWSAIVYKTGPNVTAPTYGPPAAKNPTEATVKVGGTIQANLKGSGSYSVPSASSAGARPDKPGPFQLKKVGGQWRISYAPQELLLTSNAFGNDYQLRNLYFLDPSNKYLIPDPVYVPLEASAQSLMNGLVRDLITPPSDWLSEGATRTAFPAGTKLSGVSLNGGATAIVNLAGTIAKASVPVKQQLSAQLLSTLSGAVHNGQTVQSVELEVNGKPWIPPGNQGSPVQQSSTYGVPSGASSTYYYVDNSGYLTSSSVGSSRAVRLARIGTGFSQVAVSWNGEYVAALRGGSLYAGIVGMPLVRQQGSGYVSLSWDAGNDLWASLGGKIGMFRSSGNAQRPLGQMVTVNVYSPYPAPQNVPPYANIKVAPDGVRVAIVTQGGSALTFGAISGRHGPSPSITLSTVQYQPASLTQSNGGNGSFTGLSWYGSDNVITLATPGPVVTEYPVSGGTPTTISADPGMQTVTASSGKPLIAGLPKGKMAYDAGTSGSWLPLAGKHGAPVLGSYPVYPG